MVGTVSEDREDGPCAMCGSSVSVYREDGEMSMADITPPTVWRRVCDNAGCGSNTGDMSIADFV